MTELWPPCCSWKRGSSQPVCGTARWIEPSALPDSGWQLHEPPESPTPSCQIYHSHIVSYDNLQITNNILKKVKKVYVLLPQRSLIHLYLYFFYLYVFCLSSPNLLNLCPYLDRGSFLQLITFLLLWLVHISDLAAGALTSLLKITFR